MEQRTWRIRSQSERDVAILNLSEDGFAARPEDRLVGKCLTIEAGPSDWPLIEAVLLNSAPSSERM